MGDAELPRPRARGLLAEGWVVVLFSILVPIGIYFLLPLERDTWIVGASIGAAAVVAVVPLTIRHLQRIQASSRPLADALRALALLLSLAIAGFATINYGIAANTDQIPDLRTKIDGLYFTVVTMTSVGYGDIAPKGQTARALVTVQIIVTLTLVGGSVRMISTLAGNKRAGG